MTSAAVRLFQIARAHSLTKLRVATFSHFLFESLF